MKLRLIVWQAVVFTFKVYMFLKGFFSRKRTPELTDHGVLFVHPPKSAGLAIRKIYFSDEVLRGHLPAVYWRSALGKEYKKVKVFSIIRDPAKRFRSAFFFMKNGGLTDRDRKVSRRLGFHRMEFSDFVERLESDLLFSCRVLLIKHFLPQVWYVTDCFGDVIVGDLLPLEQPEKIETWMSQNIGIKKELERVNETFYPDLDKTNVDIESFIDSCFFQKIYGKDVALWKGLVGPFNARSSGEG
ncbi:hypothetical protein ACLD02_12700 [Alloalcanivorax sp. C16-2]|uniref:hypothetical protein n=1 Tax=Alloalcanivorax sp. C16-2 TaxID=3390052 RepID=UPI0039708C2D